MKAADIEVGAKYHARISGRFVTVRVDGIRTTPAYRRSNYSGKAVYGDKTVYDVTNLATGRTTTFKSAAKFRGRAT